MIFVTVGTDHHEFPRLLKQIDLLIEKNMIVDKVIVQYGLNKYVPRHASQVYDFLPFDKMISLIKEATVVITHASSTAMLALLNNKVPLVVPREARYNEAVDDHQVEFAEAVAGKIPFIILRDEQKLGEVINNYNRYRNDVLHRCGSLKASNRDSAIEELTKLVETWFGNRS